MTLQWIKSQQTYAILNKHERTIGLRALDQPSTYANAVAVTRFGVEIY